MDWEAQNCSLLMEEKVRSGCVSMVETKHILAE